MVFRLIKIIFIMTHIKMKIILVRFIANISIIGGIKYVLIVRLTTIIIVNSNGIRKISFIADKI